VKSAYTLLRGPGGKQVQGNAFKECDCLEFGCVGEVAVGRRGTPHPRDA